MLEKITSYNTKTAAHPKHDVEKTEAWHLDWGKFIYGQFLNGNNGIMGLSKMVRLRSYAKGKQDVNQYKSLLLNNQQDTQSVPTSTVDEGVEARKQVLNEGFMAVDFNKIYNPMPKFIKNLVGKLESTEHEIVVNAIDRYSGFEKEKEKAKILFESKFAKDLAPVDEMNNIMPPKPQYMPESEEDLEMFVAAGGIKLGYEVEIEKVINHAIYTKTNIKDVKRRCLVDGITLNLMTLMDDIDKQTQQAYLKYVNPDDVIIQYCKDGQFQNAGWAAVQEYYTIADLRLDNPSMTEEEILKIATSANNKYGNIALGDEDWGQTMLGYYKYDDFRIPVLHFFVKSFDRKHTVRTTRKNGTYKDEVRVNELGKLGKDQKSMSYSDVRTIYEGKWIMGTDKVFCTGKMSNIPFNSKTKDVAIPLHVVEIIGEPMVESAIPLLDQLQLDFLKLQNLKAVSPPPGWIIELGALEEVSFDNTTWSPLDLLRLATQTGTIIYKASVSQGSIPGTGGSYTSGKPVQWNPGGMGRAIYECVFSLEKSLQLLAENMGIDRVSAVMKNPNDQSVGVTQMGVDSTSNTLQPIYDGWVDVKEQAANSVACRVPSIIYFNRNNHDVGYYDIIGRAGYRIMEQVYPRHPIQFGVNIYAKPTEIERKEIKDAAMIAMQAGKNGTPGISMADYMLIVNMMNRPHGLNFARVFLAYKEQKRAEEDKAAGQENILLQSKASAENEKQKVMLDVEAAKEKSALEIAGIRAKGEEDRKTLALKYSLESGVNVPEVSAENGAGFQEAMSMSQPQEQQPMEQPEMGQPMGEQPMAEGQPTMM